MSRSPDFWVPHLPSQVRDLALLIFVAAAYGALARLALWMGDPADGSALFWPAGGFATGVLILAQRRRWAWVLGGVAVGEILNDLTSGYPLMPTLWWTLGNVVGPLLGASTTLGVIHARTEDRRSPWGTTASFVVFAVGIGPLVGSAFGSYGTTYSGDPWLSIWPSYFLGDALGVLVFAPVVLAQRVPWPRRGWSESMAFLIAVAVIPVIAFWRFPGPLGLVPEYSVLILFTWAAVRFGFRGSSLAVAVAAVLAHGAVGIGRTPFYYEEAPLDPFASAQLFLALSAISTLLIAALVSELREREYVEAELRDFAFRDSLTGLSNRAGLRHTLEGELAGWLDSGGLTLLLCDLDHLKVVNDSLGHATGDEVLVEVARRLSSALEGRGVAARLGGDEFVLAVPACSRDDGRALGDAVLRALDAPIQVNSGSLRLSISVGAIRSRPDETPESLLRDADVALYRAKDLGRNRLVWFDAELREQALRRLAIVNDHRAALANGELTWLYQPEVDLASGKTIGFEALARWHHPVWGDIPPSEFVPIIDSSGGGPTLFETALHAALSLQARWKRQYGETIVVSVNLSPRILDDQNLIDLVDQALRRHGGPPAMLWLEVTEDALAEPRHLQLLTEIRRLGVKLAIDDFGTGWASIARLTGSRWNLLKIDRSFIQAIGTTPEADSVVQAMIGLAHTFDVRVAAEGVETVEQLEWLAAAGCDLVQGYLLGAPGTPDALPDLVGQSALLIQGSRSEKAG